MKAITVDAVGGELKVSDIEVPEPAVDELLVKPIYAAVNPVETFLINGVLVESWPLTPGCDVGGIVVKVGKNAISALGEQWKVGDRICGCTRVGVSRYAAFQEYNLVDAELMIPLPKNLSLLEGSTVGVASYTAALAIFQQLKVPVPDPHNLPAQKEEWALVLGGGSSVGKMSIQILKACGYKVVATASARSVDMLKSIGADAVVDYKQSQENIIAEITSKTSGKMYKIFDAVAQNNAFSIPMFAAISGGEKHFTTTNDWDPLPESQDFHASYIGLGPIGRDHATELNDDIKSYIPFLTIMLEKGTIKPSEYVQVGETGVDQIPLAYAFQTAGKGGNKKVVVKVQDE